MSDRFCSSKPQDSVSRPSRTGAIAVMVESHQHLVCLQIALGEYLDKFTDAELEAAHPGSAIRNNVRTYNRLKNIIHGSHPDFDLDRKPFHRLNARGMQAELDAMKEARRG